MRTVEHLTRGITTLIYTEGSLNIVCFYIIVIIIT